MATAAATAIFRVTSAAFTALRAECDELKNKCEELLIQVACIAGLTEERCEVRQKNVELAADLEKETSATAQATRGKKQRS